MTSLLESGSLLTISQQDLAALLPVGEGASRDPSFAAARVCVVHTLEAARELSDPSPTPAEASRRLADEISFLSQQAIYSDDEPSTEYYLQGRGWLLYKLADRFRASGSLVVVQNLNYGPESDVNAVLKAGRIRSEAERQIFETRMQYGGIDHKSKWIGALDETLRDHGLVVPIVRIPRMDGNGLSGHSVLVVGHEDDQIVYFDADSNAIKRYDRNNIKVPDITRITGDDRLMYSQPESQFLDRMSGEVIHLFHQDPSQG